MTTSKLVPKLIPLEIAGEHIVIKPFGYGQLPFVSSRIAPVFAALGSFQAGASIDFVRIMESGGNDLMEVLALAAGKSRDWLDTLDFDAGVALTQAVFDVNKEQLVKKILPKLMEMHKAPETAVAAG